MISNFHRFLIFCIFFLPSLSNATNGFLLEGYGPVSKAMGGSGAADDIDNFALMYNPATLGLMSDENRFTFAVDMVNTDINVTNPARDSITDKHNGKNRNPYFGASLSFATRFDNLVFGFGTFGLGGVGTEFGKQSFLSTTPGGYRTNKAIGSRLLMNSFPVGFSYQVNQQLTVGATIEALWNGWNMDTLFGIDQISGLLNLGRINGTAVPVLAGILGDSGAAHISSSHNEYIVSGFNSFGWGAKVGFTYQLSKQTRFGFVYSFKSQLDDSDGQVKVSAYGPGKAPGAPTVFTGKIFLKGFQIPAWFGFGLSHKFNEKIILNADIRHIQYRDVMKDLDFSLNLDNVGTLNILVPQNWQDLTVFSVGASYQFNDDLMLRVGGNFSQDPVDGPSMLPTMSSLPKHHLMFGINYNLSEHSKLDFAFSWAMREAVTNTEAPFYGEGSANPVLKTSVEEYNFQIGYGYRF